MQKHIARIQELWVAGLTATHVVETFVRWRIVPLKQRDTAYTYKGILDPNRESVEGTGPYLEFALVLGWRLCLFVAKFFFVMLC
jgi:hypothetical protein